MSIRRATALLGIALSCLLSSTALAAEFTLRLHTLVTSPHPYNDMAEYFKREVEARSDGRIEVKLFPGASLGQDPAIIGELGMGTVDFMISTTNNAAKQVPEYQVFSLAYLFPDMDTLMATLAPGTPVFEYFSEVYAERELGLRLLALGATGTRNLSNAVGPVTGLEDIQGLKMRTPPSPMIARTWESLGTLPVTVAWPELYAAIQTGVAEALESSIPGYMGSKLYEVAPYLALTAHTLQANHFSMSERSYQRLPEDLQQLVSEVAVAANALGLEKALEYEAEFVDTLREEHGVTVTEPDRAEFMAVVQPLHEELAEDLGVAEVLALIREQ